MSCTNNPSSAKSRKSKILASSTFLRSRKLLKQSSILSTSGNSGIVGVEPIPIVEMMSNEHHRGQIENRLQTLTPQQTIGLSREAMSNNAPTTSYQDQLMQQIVHNDLMIKQRVAELQQHAQIQQSLQNQLNANQLNPTNTNLSRNHNIIDINNVYQNSVQGNMLPPQGTMYPQQGIAPIYHGNMMPPQGTIYPQQAIAPTYNATMPNSNDICMNNGNFLRIDDLSMGQRNPSCDLNELQRSSQGDSFTPPDGALHKDDVSRRGGKY